MGIDRSIVSAALRGDRRCLHAVVDATTPVLQMCAWRALSRRRLPAQDIRAEVEDLVQEVFVALFTADGNVLRSWDPQKGCSFASFIGLVARRRIANILRSREPQASTMIGTSFESTTASACADPEQDTSSRQLLERLLDALEASLSPRGLDMFHRLFVCQEAVEAVCRETGLSEHAVYQWRTRLKVAARKALSELESSGPFPDRLGARR